MERPEIELHLRNGLTNTELSQLAGYLLRAGAGTIFPGDLVGGERIKLHARDTSEVEYITRELADALADPRDGEWETAIGRMVLASDVEGMRKAARDLHARHPACPYCRNLGRVRYRKRTGDYLCTVAACRRTWRV